MRMVVLLRKDGIAFMLLAFCAMLPTCSAQAVSDTDCAPANNDATSGESAVCKAKDVNAECPATTIKCACKDGYKEGNPDSSTCVLKAVSETDCDPANNDATTGESAACKAVNTNAECPSGGKKCKCKSGYQQDKTDANTCAKVLTGDCTENDDCTATVAHSACPSKTCSCEAGYKEASNLCEKVLTGSCSADVDCSGTVDNSKCSSSTCVCVAGYKKASNLCEKVLKGTCAADGDCTGTVANSECSATKCSCVAGYKEASNLCEKVLGGACNAPSDCTGSDANSVCSEQKCECAANFIEESAVCKSAVGKACTGTGQGDCVSNAECDQTCKCSSGFKDTNGLCAAESSATSAWRTTSLLATSLLIFLPRLICG